MAAMSSPAPSRPAVVAVVPARAGSRGVPGKNIAPVGGVPLIRRAVRTLLASDLVDEVVVSTDGPEIAAAATAGLPEGAVTIVHRPAELSGATASSEAALLHALDVLAERDGADPDVLVFVQCTSPFIEPDTVDEVAGLVLKGTADSAFTAARVHEFLWQVDASGAAVGVNHDSAVRPRRQDREPEFLETGAVYGMRVAGLREHRHRFFGRVQLVEVPATHTVEIDEPNDLLLARAIAAQLDGGAHDPVDVDAVVTDFDGVHTDDRALVLEDGTEGVMVSRSDGAGVARLRAAGVPVFILSVEVNPVVAARAKKLGVDVAHGVGDKAQVLAAWLADSGTDPARVAYVGNDLRDMACMAMVGWPVAVADALPVVRAAARLVLDRSGGHGAVRELADKVLAARATTTTKRNDT
jgi:YrbI family 3-deoxy-D-manno-octulosonate 8-phosphate phosphatase